MIQMQSNDIPYVEIYNIEDSIVYTTEDETNDIKFYVDGNEINVNEYKLLYGYTTVVYEMYGEDDNLISTGEKILLYDNESPVIHIQTSDIEIEDALYVEKDIPITITNEDISNVNVSVYVDGILTELENGMLTIHKDNTELIVECIDEMNNVSTKTIQICPIEKPDIVASQKNEAYTTDENVILKTEDKDVDITVYKNGTKLDSFLLNEKETYTFLEPGNYLFESSYKDIPYIKWNVLQLLYTNIKPSISMNVTSEYSNQDVDVQIGYYGDHIDNQSVFVNGHLVDSLNDIHLSAVDNERITYVIEAFVEDAFHQNAFISKTICIDRVLPNGYFTYQDKRIEGNSISFTDIEPVSFVQSKQGLIEAIYKYEGCEYRDISLEDMIKMMKDNTSMESMYILHDEVGNTNTVYMTWNKLKKVLQTMQQTWVSTISNKEEGIVYERLWEEDENHHLVMKQNREKFIDNVKPKIQILRNNQLQYKRWLFNDICRITLIGNKSYSNDRFTHLRINGKEIKEFQVDELGNMYYEFKVKNIRYNMDIEAVDDAGNVTKVHKTIYRIPFGLIGLLIVCLGFVWRYREKIMHSK